MDILKYLLMIVVAIMIGVAMSVLVLFGVILCHLVNPVFGIVVMTLLMILLSYLINKEDKEC